jgi:hypothetical protein
VLLLSLIGAGEARFVGGTAFIRKYAERAGKVPGNKEEVFRRKRPFEGSRSRVMAVLAGWSVDFAEIQGFVDGEIGIADEGAGGCGPVVRRSGKTSAGTLNGVGIAVALSVRHGNGIRGHEFVERSAMAVGGDEAVFRVSNLQKVHSNARQADGLRGSRTIIGGRHFLQIKAIHGEEKGGTDENAEEEAHEKIVARSVARRK